MTTIQTWTFTPLDTWFFKQALAPDSLAAQELTSLFPPSPRTLIGAIRSAVGEANHVDWKAYRGGKQPNIEQFIGKSNEPTPPNAQFSGVFIAKDGKRFYPMPLNWLAKKDDKSKSYTLFKLTPSKHAMTCDLGKVRLPLLSETDTSKTAGAKPLDGHYISGENLYRLLGSTNHTETLKTDDVMSQSNFLTEEPRLGIGRDNKTRKTEDGLLYQTKHLRLKAGVSLELDCKGWQPENFNVVMTLGGEGRLTEIEHSTTTPIKPIQANKATGIILTLATPALFTSGWLPDGFSPIQKEGIDCWQGTINGIALTLHCATLGKAHREGGWDLHKHQSRAVESFVPAGSSYFCTVDNGDIPAAINALHLYHLGQHTQLGRGLILVGTY
jgi:CRISPR-associated protein Cmr3